MRKAEVRWLYQQIPELVRQGVLTEEAAGALRRHYGEPEPSAMRSMALVIFSALGAVLVGGGITLILAHRWEDLARPARAAIALGMLLAAQAISAFALARRSGSTAWREASGGVLVVAVGASIALIGQTYHLGGDVPEFTRTVILLSLPVVYLLDSIFAAALVWAGMTIFVFGWNQGAVPGWWYWVFAAGSAPYLLRLARRSDREWRLLAALVAVSGTIAVATLGVLSSHTAKWMISLSGLFAAYWAIGARQGRGEAEGWRRAFLAFGGAGWPVLLVILTFEAPWRLLRDDVAARTEPWTEWLTLAVGIVAGALAGAHALGEARLSRWHMALPAALILPAALSWALALGYGPPPAQILMNLWLLACGIAFLATGLRAVHLGTINYGLALVSALAIARFFDTEISFLWRGIGFIVVGLAFFAVNAFMIARRKEAAA